MLARGAVGAGSRPAASRFGGFGGCTATRRTLTVDLALNYLVYLVPLGYTWGRDLSACVYSRVLRASMDHAHATSGANPP